MTQTVNSRAFQAADLDGNPYPQHTIPTSVRPWNFVPDESGRPWSGNLVRASDDASFRASADERLWPKQIFDFEVLEATTKPPDDRPWPPPTSTSEEGALPVSFGPRVEVTQEMVAAAIGACNEAPSIHWNDVAPAIYRAMHAAAPVELVSDFERRLQVARGTIGILTEDNERMHDALKVRTDERDAARECALAQGREVAYLKAVVANMPAAESVKAMLDDKDARIAELKSTLASTPVAFEDPDAKPAPVPGFLRAIRRGNKATVGLVTGRGDMPTPIDD